MAHAGLGHRPEQGGGHRAPPAAADHEQRGGAAFTTLPPVIWHRDDNGASGPTDGTVGVGGVAFKASYQPADGQRISFRAC